MTTIRDNVIVLAVCASLVSGIPCVGGEENLPALVRESRLLASPAEKIVPLRSVDPSLLRCAEEWTRSILRPPVAASLCGDWEARVYVEAYVQPVEYKRQRHVLMRHGRHAEAPFFVADDGVWFFLGITFPRASTKLRSPEQVLEVASAYLQVPSNSASRLERRSSGAEADTAEPGTAVGEVHVEGKDVPAWAKTIEYCAQEDTLFLRVKELPPGRDSVLLSRASSKKGRLLQPGLVIKARRFDSPCPSDIVQTAQSTLQLLQKVERFPVAQNTTPFETMVNELRSLYGSSIEGTPVTRAKAISELNLRSLNAAGEREKFALALVQVCEYEPDRTVRQLLIDKSVVLRRDTLQVPLPEKVAVQPGTIGQEKWQRLIGAMRTASEQPESEQFTQASDRVCDALTPALIPAVFESINSAEMPAVVRSRLLDHVRLCVIPEAFPYLTELVVDSDDRLTRRKAASAMERIVKRKLVRNER